MSLYVLFFTDAEKAADQPIHRIGNTKVNVALYLPAGNISELNWMFG